MSNIAIINLSLSCCAECPYVRKNSGEYFCIHDLKSPGLSVGGGDMIPDFCPFVLKRLEEVLKTMDSVSGYSIPKKFINQVERKQVDDPHPKFGADHGWKHAARVYNYGSEFLENLIPWGLNTPDSIQKQKLLLGIASKMHDIGLADSAQNHAIHSAELTKKYFESKKVDIDIEDACAIVHAIYNHSDGDVTLSLLDAALIMGDKLDVTNKRIVRVTDKITSELTKVESVDFSFFGQNGKAEGAELSYTTTEQFDVNALKEWPKCVAIPRMITTKFLGLSEFRFKVNDEEIDVKKLIG
jgi:HD superfamily phosphodiesterase